MIGKNLGNIGNMSDLLDKMKGKKPNQAPQETVTKPMPMQPPSRLDNVAKPPKAGTANLTLPNDPEKAIAAFQEAAKGTPIELKGDDAMSTLKNMLGYAKDNMDKGEMMNVFKFMGEMKRSDNAELLGESLQKNGITEEQLQLIADGKFSGQDYLAMVKAGDPSV